MSRPEESPPPGTIPDVFPDVFEEATADVRERILRDARRFDGDAAAVAFLEYLADHLFDQELDVDGWRRACHPATPDLPAGGDGARSAQALHRRPPHRRGLAARQETGADLTDLGRRVGYDVPRTFRRAFQRLHGKSPNELRAAGKDRTPADETSAGVDETGGGSGENADWRALAWATLGKARLRPWRSQMECTHFEVSYTGRP